MKFISPYWETKPMKSILAISHCLFGRHLEGKGYLELWPNLVTETEAQLKLNVCGS